MAREGYFGTQAFKQFAIKVIKCGGLCGVAGAVTKALHLPGANIMLIGGLAALLVGFTCLLLWKRHRNDGEVEDAKQ